MFLVNFDFSEYNFFPKLLAINVPIIITEMLTYPFQRMQVQLIKRSPYKSNNQISEMKVLLKEMIQIQKFPKIYHGLRYSLDYSITQMTFKFFLFDNMIVFDESATKYKTYLWCALANALGTLASQSAFNYQTIASSLEPDANNRIQHVEQKLKTFTKNKKVFRNGLQYTFPISILNAVSELYLITKFRSFYIERDGQYRSTKEEFLNAFAVLFLTSFTNHFAVQRQIQLCFDLKSRLSYWKGFAGTLTRNLTKGMLLYTLYFCFFQQKIKQQISSEHVKREIHNVLPEYYKGRNIT